MSHVFYVAIFKHKTIIMIWIGSDFNVPRANLFLKICFNILLPNKTMFFKIYLKNYSSSKLPFNDCTAHFNDQPINYRPHMLSSTNERGRNNSTEWDEQTSENVQNQYQRRIWLTYWWRWSVAGPEEVVQHKQT